MTCNRCKDGEAVYCIGCMNEIVAETDRALERAEARIVSLRAAVEVAEKAHENCIDELMEAQGENKELRAALFCKKCKSTGLEYGRCALKEACPTCGPLRKALREGE